MGASWGPTGEFAQPGGGQGAGGTPLQISVSKVPHDKSLRVKKGMPD